MQQLMIYFTNSNRFVHSYIYRNRLNDKPNIYSIRTWNVQETSKIPYVNNIIFEWSAALLFLLLYFLQLRHCCCAFLLMLYFRYTVKLFKVQQIYWKLYEYLKNIFDIPFKWKLRKRNPFLSPLNEKENDHIRVEWWV